MSPLTGSLVLYILVIVAIVSQAAAYGNDNRNHQRVRLEDVRVLTLYADKMATGRRSSPVPQTKCSGGDACHLFTPEVVQCTNMGSDGRSEQWKCDAEMEDYYKLGRIVVNCEGYDYPDDPYVLVGSCGVEYTLSLTDKGRRAKLGENKQEYDRYHRLHGAQRRKQTKPHITEKQEGHSWLTVFVILLIMWGLVRCCSKTPGPDATSGTHNNRPGGGWFGGGGGSNNHHDHHSAPPPPYAPYPSAPSAPFQERSSCQPDRPASSNSPTSSSTRPGFWSGFTAGGILSYLANRRNTRYNNNNTQYNPLGRSTFGYPGENDYGVGSSQPSYRPSSPPTTRVSSGYGGTERR